MSWVRRPVLAARDKTARTASETGETVIAIWPVVVGLAALTIVLLFTAEWGRFIADNRFIQFWNPSKAFRQSMHAWARQGNLGGVPGTLGMGTAVFSALLQQVGAPAWLIERLYHATLMGGGAIGAAMVTREFLPRSRLAHSVAGLWWIASPYTAAFLLPSGLYLNAALCPWLVLALLRGSTSSSRWRWAAIFALIVALSGLGNPPGLFLASLPLVPVAIYLIATRQSTASALWSWVVRAVPLLVAVLAFEASRARLVSGYFVQNLAVSETAEVANQSSSWSESLRGLGHWLAYWNLTGQLIRPALATYFSGAVTILASFLPVIIAIALVAFSRRRVTVLLGCMLLLSTTVMVGAFPIDDPSPYGRALLWLYDAVPASFTLRNTFKAGAGLLLAVSILLGLSAVTTATWRGAGDRRRRRWGTAAAVGGALVMVATAAPFWTGALYEDSGGLTTVPTYWNDAMGWLDRQDGSSRVLITPGTLETYRWGAPLGGDLFDSLMERSYVLSSSFSQVAPDTSNLISSLNVALSLGHYQQGSIGPIAHRIGVGYVLIRNDVRWEGTEVARPAAFDALRTDPALVLDATFGDAGQNVVAPGDSSEDAGRERLLPPVEIYRVRGTNEPVRAVSGPSLLISGDASSWTTLAIDGTLDVSGPIRYTGRLTAAELDAELTEGAVVVITDSNRRRLPQNGLVPGATVTTSEETASDLFDREGSESIATYGDASDIRYTGPPALVGGGIQNRPAAAFDGDPSTMFVTGGFNNLTSSDAFRIQLKRPMPVSEVSIDATASPGRRVVSVEIVFPNGVTQPLNVPTGEGTTTFAPQVVDRFDVKVTRLAGQGPGALGRTPWGIREIAIAGLDLTEVIKVPDDVMRIADTNTQVRTRLESAPISYRFERLQTSGSDEEPALRRAFRVLSDRTFTGTGTMQLRPSATNTDLASLLGTPVAARADVPLDTPLPSECNSDLATIDGVPLAVRVIGSTTQLMAGEPIEVSLCEPLDLRDGVHEIRSGTGFPFSRLNLESTEGSTASRAREHPVRAVWNGETEVSTTVDGGTRLIIGQALNGGWRASTEQQSLGGPIELDTQTGWIIPPGGPTTVDATFAPERTSRILLAVLGAAVLACLALAVLDPRSPSARRSGGRHFARSAMWDWVPDVAAVAFGGMIAGLSGLVLAAVALALLRKRWFASRAVAAICVGYVVAAAAYSVPPLGPEFTFVSPAWPVERLRAHEMARFAAVLLAVLLARWQRHSRGSPGWRATLADPAHEVSRPHGASRLAGRRQQPER